MDKSRYHVKKNKSDWDKQIPHDFSCIHMLDFILQKEWQKYKFKGIIGSGNQQEQEGDWTGWRVNEYGWRTYMHV
jgi:hypothetical protein